MNWQKPDLGTAEHPASPWALEARPSLNTTYVIHDMGNGSYTAVVTEKRGNGTVNTLINENIQSITDLQTLCDNDWNKGLRR